MTLRLFFLKGIYTPSASSILGESSSTLEKELGRPCTEFMMKKWIPQSLKEHKRAIFNVVLVDFVDHLRFSERLIRLNFPPGF